MNKLNYSGQEISVFPPLDSHEDIKYIDISSTNIENLPEWIYGLTELEVLNIHDTRIMYIDSRIGNLKNLKKLDISGTKIKELPKDIINLKNLIELYAYDMELVESDFEKIFPDNLIRLDISNTKIHQIPSNIFKMKELKLLNISKTEIGNLPQEIENLQNLEMLNISRTKITRIPSQIGNLGNLQTINASFSRLEALPNEIGNASSIRKILIDYTKITALPDIFRSLGKLQLLNISGLYLDYIPQSLANSELEFISTERRYIENGIVISNTVLSKMPLSILLQNKELLKDYYQSEKITFNEGKIILLGNGDVGKSYIVDRILNNGEKFEDNYEPSVTQGISVKLWKVNANDDMKINIWDFGGQEIIHSLHKMFLTERSLYLIVLNARYDTLQFEAEKWLRTVDSFAPKSNVILIINKVDLNQFASVNETFLYERFSNLKYIMKISAKYDEKTIFNRVVDLIKESCIAEMFGMQIPIAWNQIRLELEGNNKKYIKKITYKSICKKYNVVDTNIQNWILEWFRDIGVCFIVDIESLYNRNYIILDSQWVLNLIYTIICFGKKKNENGYLDVDELCSFFEDKEDKNEQYTEFTIVLDIMRQFRISYNSSLDFKKEFMPLLLEKNEKMDAIVWCNKANYIFECRYDYLPINLFHQVYLSLFSKIQMKEYWYSGIFFTCCNTDITVCIKICNNVIQIYVADLDVLSSKKITEILSVIAEISNKMNLLYETYIGINENALLDYFSYERIRVMLLHKRTKDFSHILEREIDLKKLNEVLQITIDPEEEKAEIDSKVNQYVQNYGAVEKVVNINFDGKPVREENVQLNDELDINEIVKSMRNDINRAEIDESYEIKLKKNNENFDFKKLVLYIEQCKWPEFYKQYVSIIKSNVNLDKAGRLVDVIRINFSLGIAIWKYYRIYILIEDNIPFFFFMPLDTQIFPIAICFNERKPLFDEGKFISYLKNYEIFNLIKGSEYRDILLIQGVMQNDIKTTIEYIHYK